MGMIDRQYFGMAKIYAPGNSTLTDGEKSYTGTSTSAGLCFLVPGKTKYTLTIGDKSQDIYVSYGECRKIGE